MSYSTKKNSAQDDSDYRKDSGKPLFLLTNDDGVLSPGLRAAAETAALFGDVLIAAPRTQQTGMGRGFPRAQDTGIIDELTLTIKGKNQKAYGIHGSPALSVAHGVMELADRKPDLCISGINYGENLGQVLTCSGTAGAALEAASYGIPAIAVSLAADLSIQQSEDYQEMDWSAAQWILKKVIAKVLAEGMPKGVELWNVNVPARMTSAHEEPLFPYCLTRQSRQNYFCFQKAQKRDLQKPYRLEAKLEVDMESLEKDSDIYAVYAGHQISVTPLTIDMTARGQFEDSYF